MSSDPPAASGESAPARPALRLLGGVVMLAVKIVALVLLAVPGQKFFYQGF